MTSLRTYRNLPFSGKNELIGASIERNSTLSSFPVVFQAQTPCLAQSLTLALAADLAGMYINVDLQRAP